MTDETPTPDPPPMPPKPGWLSSEWFATAAVIVTMVVAMLDAFGTDWAVKFASILAAGLAAGGYAISRGIAKSG
ncbi:MAG: hypothetical protein JXQ29_08380 [Planctomycetes bacterium]|nr:hypothetical protein [Planctomycetota bacterium]